MSRSPGLYHVMMSGLCVLHGDDRLNIDVYASEQSRADVQGRAMAARRDLGPPHVRGPPPLQMRTGWSDSMEYLQVTSEQTQRAAGTNDHKRIEPSYIPHVRETFNALHMEETSG